MELDIKLDRANFPTVYIPPLDAYMHWLPVTKIQMEYFLCYTSEATYDDAWYQNVIGFNRRVSPGNVTVANYWEAFVTGVIPRDALNYARWCRESYTLPIAADWFTAYEFLLSTPADPNHIEQILSTAGLSERVKILLRNVENSAQNAEFELNDNRTLADQMLLRLGVMEFVYRDQGRNTFGGYGQTHSGFFPQMEIPQRDAPQVLSNSREGAQLKQYGFRLINKTGRR